MLMLLGDGGTLEVHMGSLGSLTVDALSPCDGTSSMCGWRSQFLRLHSLAELQYCITVRIYKQSLCIVDLNCSDRFPRPPHN